MELCDANCRDSFMCAVILVLGFETEMLREHFPEPLQFHGCGHSKQGERSAFAADLADRCGDKHWRFLYNTLARQSPSPSSTEKTIQSALVFANAQLIHKSGQNAPLQILRAALDGGGA